MEYACFVDLSKSRSFSHMSGWLVCYYFCTCQLWLLFFDLFQNKLNPDVQRTKLPRTNSCGVSCGESRLFPTSVPEYHKETAMMLVWVANFSMIFLCVHVWCVFLLLSRAFMCGVLFLKFFLVCSCVVCFSAVFTCVHVWCVVFQIFSCVFMCGVFFCCFHVHSCVAFVFQEFSCVFNVWRVVFHYFSRVFMCGVCFHWFSCVFMCVFLLFSRVFMCGVFFIFFQWVSCVFMCGVCFSMIFLRVHVWCVVSQTFSCVFTCGVCFSMIFLCVHVWCVSLLFSRGQNTDDSFGGEGQIKFVTNTSPALVTFFSAPPPHSQTKRQMMLQRGFKFVKNMSPALVTFFSPPPPKVWKSYSNYG